MMTPRFFRISGVLAVLAGLLLTAGCDLADPNPNREPDTSLANIPVEGDTLFSLVTLHWNGGDADGFVAAYEYRYVTYLDATGDSLVQEWQRTEATSATIAFSSTEAVNRQRFEVRAIDNEGNTDPSPAVKTFFTTQSFAPAVQIVAPAPGTGIFVLDETTDWWQGVPLTFTGTDRDGIIEAYGWSVDGSDWTWTRDTTLFIPPSAFRAPLDGTHTIRVTARDNTDLVNPEGTSVEIRLIRPTFERDVLIVDETNEANFNAALGKTDADVDAFYADLFTVGGVVPDTWDYLKQGMPSREELGRYRVVIWHADDKPTNQPHALARELDAVKDYLNVGGSIVMSGWRVLKSFAWRENFPQTFSEGTFVNDYMQIADVDETPLLADFVGAKGLNGFPDLKVDASKLNYFPNFGTLNNINIIQRRGGFTEVIAAYEAKEQTKYPQYRGVPVGLIYYGTSFNAAVLGFPLYFIEKEQAQQFAGTILERMQRQRG